MWQQTSRPGGYSLLEILLVLAIIGIVLAGVAVSYVQADNRRIEDQAARLRVLLAQVSDRAALSNRRHRLIMSAEEIQIQEFVDARWRNVFLHQARTEKWVEGVRLQNPSLQIFIDSSGLISAQEVHLRYQQIDRRLMISPFGEVSFAGQR